MGRHAARPAQHRGVRPRYGRIGTALAAVLTTAVALLGAGGLLPSGQSPAEASVSSGTPEALDPGSLRRPDPVGPMGATLTRASLVVEQADTTLPAGSGVGRRIVFDMSAQRVWLVRRGGAVHRTYLVSGSLTDNLEPGTYTVYSKSEHALGIDDSGTMRYMVRFARGDHAAIGFHDIPVHRGARVQTRAELGTPQSHGCIRQARPDARALWDFAPAGTRVVVLA